MIFSEELRENLCMLLDKALKGLFSDLNSVTGILPVDVAQLVDCMNSFY